MEQQYCATEVYCGSHPAKPFQKCPEGPNEGKNPHKECMRGQLLKLEGHFECLNRADKKDVIFNQDLYNEVKRTRGLNLNKELEFDEHGFYCSANTKVKWNEFKIK